MRAIRGSQLARLLANWRPNSPSRSPSHSAPRGPSGPEYQALAQALCGLLVDGRLSLQLRLPAERELAAALRSSRTTVSAAYRVLREAGYLHSRRGAGSWTALPDGHRINPAGLLTRHDEAELLDLSFAAPAAPKALPDAVAEAVEELPRYAAGHGYFPMGIAPLRQAVAEWHTRRGAATSAAQILITSGAQQGHDLLLRLLASPGETVLIESPTYPNAPVAARAQRLQIASYGLGPGGWDAELLTDTVRQVRPRTAYVCADFHNPTGHVMPAQVRARLVAAAHAAGTMVIVDETFADLAIDSPPLPPPVAAYDRHGLVLTTGSMSKAYWGGLRIGWIRGPASLLTRLAASRAGADLGSPVLEQLIATRLLARQEEVLAARREELRHARDHLAGTLAERLPQWRFTLPGGGVGLWLELDAPVSSALARAAETFRLRIAPGPRFGVDGVLEHCLRLPFTVPQADLSVAVDRLIAARAALSDGVAHDWPPSLVVT